MLHILEHVVKKGQKGNYSYLDLGSFYLSMSNYPQKSQDKKFCEDNAAELEEESSLEAELAAIPAIGNEEDDSSIPSHLPLDDSLMQDFGYNEKAANGITMYEGVTSPLAKEEEYKVAGPAEDASDAALSIDEEARTELRESKYEFMVPDPDVDFEEQQRLAMWIQFNPGLYAFLESFYGLNRECDYKSSV
ncbi:hypothetical protein HY494_00310 [Candidatus Woesearchaeota archaeon]|nr:hypothetical protein [Candidatus Woesearchaeota archaeon]